MINNTFRVSRYLLIIPKQTESHEVILTRSYIYPFAFKQRLQEGFRARLYLVSFLQLYCWKVNICTTQREKGRLSYPLLDILSLVRANRENISKYIHNSLSNLSHLPAVDQGIEG